MITDPTIMPESKIRHGSDDNRMSAVGTSSVFPYYNQDPL